MIKELVSIIITTYSRPELIVKAVNNCLEQTYEKIEVIVIDDNGIKTENQIKTERLIQPFLREEKIQYYALDTNTGACYARNFGVKKSNGEFISFFDEDDEWTQDKIELQISPFRNSFDVGMVLCGQKAINIYTNKEYFRYSYSLLNENAFNKLLNSNISFATPNPLIKVKAFNDIGGFTVGLSSAQDLEFGLRLTQKYKVSSIDKICLTSYVHSNDRISSNHKGKIDGFKYILYNYKNKLSKEGEIFYWQRILMHGFFGKLKNESKESKINLSKLGGFNIKYKCFYLGTFNPFIRWSLKMYLKLGNSLYK